MQSSPYKIKALQEQFWQLSWHLAPPRTFFCFSTQANSKNNHDWSPAEFVFQMPWKVQQNLYFRCLEKHCRIWVPPCRFIFSNPLYSPPHLRFWHMELSKSCQLSFQVFLTELNYFFLILSDSFTQERAWAEKKKKKSWNCSVVRRTETIWVAAVEFSVWYGSKSLVPFPVLTFLFSRCLMLIFKVTDMEVLEKVWLLAFFYILFFPVCF